MQNVVRLMHLFLWSTSIEPSLETSLSSTIDSNNMPLCALEMPRVFRLRLITEPLWRLYLQSIIRRVRPHLPTQRLGLPQVVKIVQRISCLRYPNSTPG